MNHEQKQRMLGLIAFTPFFVFVPLSLFSFFFVGAFWLYFAAWVWTCAVRDKKGPPSTLHWGAKALLRIIGVIILQLIIVLLLSNWIMKK